MNVKLITYLQQKKQYAIEFSRRRPTLFKYSGYNLNDFSQFILLKEALDTEKLLRYLFIKLEIIISKKTLIFFEIMILYHTPFSSFVNNIQDCLCIVSWSLCLVLVITALLTTIIEMFHVLRWLFRFFLRCETRI